MTLRARRGDGPMPVMMYEVWVIWNFSFFSLFSFLSFSYLFLWKNWVRQGVVSPGVEDEM